MVPTSVMLPIVIPFDKHLASASLSLTSLFSLLEFRHVAPVRTRLYGDCERDLEPERFHNLSQRSTRDAFVRCNIVTLKYRYSLFVRCDIVT